MALTCARHTAALFDRGGMNRLSPIMQLGHVRWNRVRDDMSQAQIVIPEPNEECLPFLRSMSPNRTELVIFRDTERVWEGPITLTTIQGTQWAIEAKDISYYLHRTVMEFEHNNGAYWVDGDPPTFVDNTGPAVDRAFDIITEELNRVKENPLLVDPVYNVVPHLVTVRADPVTLEAETSRVTEPYQMTVLDDLEALAARGGLDYVVVGRSIILNDTRVPVGMTPPVTEDDFLGEVIISMYGFDSFTEVFTTGENGMHGHAGGVDDYYGEIQYCESMIDEDSTEPPSQNSLDNAAEWNMYGKLPVPVVVRLPDNTAINPNGVLSLEHLVPGVRIPLRADFDGTVLTQMQKLNTVSVEETPAGEVITVSMTTAPKERAEEEGGEEE